jgi:mono/diheme cytochrome c family protein
MDTSRGLGHQMGMLALMVCGLLSHATLTQAPQSSGKATYAANCASCHGAEGKGNGADGMYFTPSPTDFTTAAFAQESDTEIHQAIAKGKGNMPGFQMKLSDAAIDEVIAYLRTLAPAPTAKKPAKKKRAKK